MIDYLAYRWLKLKVKFALNFGRDRYGAIMFLDWRIIYLGKNVQGRHTLRQLSQQKYKTYDSFAVGPWLLLKNEDDA